MAPISRPRTYTSHVMPRTSLTQLAEFILTMRARLAGNRRYADRMAELVTTSLMSLEKCPRLYAGGGMTVALSGVDVRKSRRSEIQSGSIKLNPNGAYRQQ